MAKGIYALFAVTAYAIFLATFLYLIGFVGDFPLLPATVDSDALPASPVAILIDVALIAAFGIQHSVMARQGIKRAMAAYVPKPVERSLYVLVSSVLLMILFVFWQPLAGDIWRVENGALSIVLWALFAAGWMIVLFSTFLLNHFELFGLQQVYLHARGRTAAEPQLREPLFYKLVRHPLYSGFFIAFWATPHMTVGHLLLAFGLSVYIVIGIHYEERDMVDMFGSDYETYRQRVGMLTPRVSGVRGRT
ncbi:MAG: Protein-S-isoprenylcysteine O-methyltransferase Ste14 [Sphingomonadales bacterium]|nr:Protein-S-isoprenylcysteine O-methyltransferase Ste14 [Sphingomonadales bacterium]